MKLDRNEMKTLLADNVEDATILCRAIDTSVMSAKSNFVSYDERLALEQANISVDRAEKLLEIAKTIRAALAQA